MKNGLRVDECGVHTLGGIHPEPGPGRCIGLTAPTGCGKTLLLRADADPDPHQGRMWLGSRRLF